jgi:hypothetical protein
MSNRKQILLAILIALLSVFIVIGSFIVSLMEGG